MQNNCIKNLLNLKGVVVKNIKNLKDLVEVYIELPVVEQVCPHCGAKTTKIHDYYTQHVNSKLPRVLCIDEFKENSGNYKYQVALINGETHEVVDIIECRYKHVLCDYFKKFPKEQLDNVKYLVSDLWETYKDIGMTYFRKAKIVADHFHFARYACNAVNEIRIEVQKKLPDSERKYFKNYRK